MPVDDLHGSNGLDLSPNALHPPNRTHTFDNRSHRAGVPRLERGSNHGVPTPLTSASRCGSVGLLFRLGECTTMPDPSGEYDETRGGVDPKMYGSFY